MTQRILCRLVVAGTLGAGVLIAGAVPGMASTSDPLYHARQITCGKHVAGAYICITMNYRGGSINGYSIVAIENYRIYVKGHPKSLSNAKLGGLVEGNRTKRGPIGPLRVVRDFGGGGVPIVGRGYTFSPSWRNDFVEVGPSEGGEQCGAAEVDTSAGKLYDQNCMVGTTSAPTPPLPGM